MIEKITLAEAEAALQTGRPNFMRGISSKGDGLKVNKEQLLIFIGVRELYYSLQPGQEIEIQNPSYGLYILSCGELGCTALYLQSSYTRGYVAENGYSEQSKSFGDMDSGRDIEFGRRETNGIFYLKNNTVDVKSVRIKMYYYNS